MHHAGYVSTEVPVFFVLFKSVSLSEIGIKTITMIRLDYAKLSACVRCPLCNKLFTNATTISECCHSFCRACIDKKLIDDKLNHCPVCNSDLGCSPLDKLRPDHRLQDLRDKIFPLKKEKCAKASPVKLKINKKRKSPSSLSTREVEAEEDENNGRVKVLEGASTIASARRAKAAARIKFICSAPSPTCQLNKAVGEEEKQNGDSSEVENSNSTLKIRIPNSSKANSSLRIETNKRDNADLNLPISCLAEAGSKHKLLKASTMQENGATQVLVRSNDNANASDQNESIPSIQEKTPGISADLNFPAQPEIGSNTENNKGFGPIWFCLVAAEEKKTSARLPQLSSCYLRVRDSSVTVSYIKKYLIKKLGLASENEVEIMLQGEPLYSSLQLKNLIDKWLQSGPKTEIHTSVGSSAKDFIMVLSYGRKA